MCNEKEEKYSDFQWYETIFGVFGNTTTSSLKAVMKINKTVKFEKNIFTHFFEVCIKDSAVKLLEERSMTIILDNEINDLI